MDWKCSRHNQRFCADCEPEGFPTEDQLVTVTTFTYATGEQIVKVFASETALADYITELTFQQGEHLDIRPTLLEV